MKDSRTSHTGPVLRSFRPNPLQTSKIVEAEPHKQNKTSPATVETDSLDCIPKPGIKTTRPQQTCPYSWPSVSNLARPGSCPKTP
jgi:hypothetical protein